ncbi:MAG TPA: helix-turn-helix transcriptional regulator [Anaerolineae bacterium]|nr:helix-turn-helix transcriptional regulator [Anaerolineae bacterium]
MLTFGQVLREMREERKLTQGQLSYKAQTTAEYISMIENGDRTPATGLLIRLTKALGTTPDYMLRRAGMLETNSHTPLEPEVQHIADLLSTWPEGQLKSAARAIVITTGETLEHVLEALGDENQKERRGEGTRRTVS